MKLILLVFILSFYALSDPGKPPSIDFSIVSTDKSLLDIDDGELCTLESQDKKEEIINRAQEKCRKDGSLGDIVNELSKVFTKICGESVSKVITAKINSKGCAALKQNIIPALKEIQDKVLADDKQIEKDNKAIENAPDLCKEDQNLILRCYDQGKKISSFMKNSIFKIATVSAFTDHNTELFKSSRCDCIEKKIDELGVAYPSEEKKKKMVHQLDRFIKKEMINDINNELELLIQDFSSHNQKIPTKCERPFNLLKKNIPQKLSKYNFSSYLDRHSKSPEPQCGSNRRVSRSDFFQVSEAQSKGRTNPELRSVDTALISLVSTIENLSRKTTKCLDLIGLNPDKVSPAEIIVMSERPIASIFPSSPLEISPECFAALNSVETNNLKNRIYELKENKILESFSKSIGQIPFLRQALMTPVSKLGKIIKRSSRDKDKELMLFDRLEANPKGLSQSLTEIASQRCEMLADKIEDIQKVQSIVKARENSRGLTINKNKHYSKQVINEMINTYYKKRSKYKTNTFTEHVDFFTFLAEDYCEESRNYAFFGDDREIKLPKTKIEIPSLLSDESLLYLNKNESKEINIPILEYANKLCEDPNYKTSFEKLVEAPEARGCFIFGSSCSSPTLKESASVISKSISQPSSTTTASSINEAIRSIGATTQERITSSYSSSETAPQGNRNLANLTKPSQTTDKNNDDKYQRLIDEISELKKNQQEINDYKNQYTDKLFSKEEPTSSEIQQFEEKLARLEKENESLRNKVNNITKTDQTSGTGAKSFSTNPRQASTADFKAAQKIMSDQVKENSKSGNNGTITKANANIISQLSSRQIASITNQISGNNPISRDDAVVINVDSIDNLDSKNVNGLLENLNKDQITDIQNAILKKQAIVIRANNSNRNLTISPDSKDYALIAGRYKDKIESKIEQVSSKGSAARSIASEVQKNYQELLNNSLNFISN